MNRQQANSYPVISPFQNNAFFIGCNCSISKINDCIAVAVIVKSIIIVANLTSVKLTKYIKLGRIAS